MYTFLLSEGSTIEESELQTIEENYNFSFPKIIRDFLLHHNDARIREIHLNIENGEYDVVRFLDVDTLKMLLYEAQKHQEPIEYIPFAEDWGGDLFCWKKDDGGIYISYPDSDVPILLVDSVEQFFRMIEDSSATKEVSLFETLQREAEELLRCLMKSD